MTTSKDTKLAWESVADHLEALGLKLKLHFDQAGQPAGEISEAFDRLGSTIESTFAAIGAAVEDPAVRDGANSLAVALGNALADTISQAGQELAAAADGLRCQHGQVRGEVPKQSSDTT